jgi:hypothetical protein
MVQIQHYNAFAIDYNQTIKGKRLYLRLRKDRRPGQQQQTDED